MTSDPTGKRGVSAQVERMASEVSSLAQPTASHASKVVQVKMTKAGDVHVSLCCRYSTWEPEEHILDQRLVQAYEEK